MAETRARDSAPGSATAECVSSVLATVSATAETHKIGFGRSLHLLRKFAAAVLVQWLIECLMPLPPAAITVK